MVDSASRDPRVPVVLVAFLLVSAAASVLLAEVQAATGLDPEVLTLAQLSTVAGALFVWGWWRSRLPRPPTTRTGWGRPLLIAAAVVAVIATVLAVIRGLLRAPWPSLAAGSLPVPLGLVALAQLVGAAGEEIGWRGVVQPALETRLAVLPAALVTGLLFGLGHAGSARDGLSFAVFLVAAVGLSVALAHLTAGRRTLDRVVLATGVHWLVNLATLVGFSDGDGSVSWQAATAVAAAVAAGVARFAARAGDVGPRSPEPRWD